MVEMSFDYWNKLADQMIVISSLLAGFSIAVVANFLVSDTNTRLSRTILKAAVFAASFFLVTVFSMTKVLMLTTEGFPFPVTESDFEIPFRVGGITLLFGIMSFLTMISLSGWTKTKALGKFTTTVGIYFPFNSIYADLKNQLSNGINHT